MVLISVIFFVLASVCNSVMDICSHHYYGSIFSKYSNYFWNTELSWKNKYINRDPRLGFKKLYKNINYPVQLTDAWHLFKSLMIVFLTLSVITFDSSLVSGFVSFVLLLGIYGLIWNLTFNLFYNNLFKKN